MQIIAAVAPHHYLHIPSSDQPEPLKITTSTRPPPPISSDVIKSLTKIQ